MSATPEIPSLIGIIDELPAPSQETEKAQAIDVPTGCPVDLSDLTTQALTDEINRQGGRIPYSTFMDLSLYGPDGYYSAGKVQLGGEREHFLTSPEQSEFFGATIGNGLSHVWEAMGKPTRFDIVEIGAGGGALAFSLLGWMEKVHPDFYDAIQYTILERGKELTPRQKERVGKTHKVNWVLGSAYDLPFKGVKGAFISNELPDVFPIERVTLRNGKPMQVYVTQKDGEWVEVYDTPQSEVQNYIDRYHLELDERFEEPINLNAERFQQELDQALEQGVIVTVDYGYPHQVGGYVGEKSVWFRGFDRNGTDVKYQRGPVEFANPGDVDITALVDFEVLEEIAKQDGLEVVASGLQPDLLRRCGMADFLWKANNVVRQGSYLDRLNFMRQLESTSKILNTKDLGEYYAHVLAKGVPGEIFSEPSDELSDPTLSDEEQLEERRRQLKIVVDSLELAYDHVYLQVPGQKEIMISFNNVFGEKRMHTVKIVHGSAELYPLSLKNAMIYDAEGELLYNLHTDEALEDFLRKARYAG